MYAVPRQSLTSSWKKAIFTCTVNSGKSTTLEGQPAHWPVCLVSEELRIKPAQPPSRVGLGFGLSFFNNTFTVTI